MNCPAKTDPIVSDGHNQNPSDLAADLTTNSDSGHIANARHHQDHKIAASHLISELDSISRQNNHDSDLNIKACDGAKSGASVSLVPLSATVSHGPPGPDAPKSWSAKTLHVLRTYLTFVGPGMMISVAYIDPGNYATDVQAGATYRFKLLFIILLSNFFAVFLQSLCIKLGTVTGLSVSQMVRTHWPSWANYLWFLFSMAAIAATDVAEVIGTAIALSLLSNGTIPMPAACAMCFGDVIFIIVFYRSSRASTRARRVFEFFVALLVIGVAICFCIQLSYLKGVTAGEVFHGFVPSPQLVQRLGLYLGCGIVGATVMPHSLILGSGLVQGRLIEFDEKHNLISPQPLVDDAASEKRPPYRPSLKAIRHCISYSIADNCISLLTFALFVNSAILIVAGASLSSINGAANANLFGIYDLLARTLNQAVATMFAIALLLSGLSAGIVVTMAGQVAVEGHLNVQIRPWKLRLLIRAVSVPISIVVAAKLGIHGLNTALVGSQVTLCVLLPCISLPLVWFTCQTKYMTVTTDAHGRRASTASAASGGGLFQRESEGTRDATESEAVPETTTVNMRNNYVTSFFVIVIWLVISMMNIAMLVLIATGKA